MKTIEELTNNKNWETQIHTHTKSGKRATIEKTMGGSYYSHYSLYIDTIGSSGTRCKKETILKKLNEN